MNLLEARLVKVCDCEMGRNATRIWEIMTGNFEKSYDFGYVCEKLRLLEKSGHLEKFGRKEVKYTQIRDRRGQPSFYRSTSYGRHSADCYFVSQGSSPTTIHTGQRTLEAFSRI